LNSLILITNGRFLLDLYEKTLPELWRGFERLPMIGTARDFQNPRYRDFFRSVPVLDFSRDLLESTAEHLWVYPVPECGWLDVGTPERLTRHLIAHRDCDLREEGAGPLQIEPRGDQLRRCPVGLSGRRRPEISRVGFGRGPVDRVEFDDLLGGESLLR